MATVLSRRRFVGGSYALALLAAARADSLLRAIAAAGTDNVIAATSAGKVRGLALDDVKVFKGIPYGGTTAGKNRFMPPTKPVKWKGVRDPLPYRPAPPQIINVTPGTPEHAKTCLLSNDF